MTATLPKPRSSACIAASERGFDGRGLSAKVVGSFACAIVDNVFFADQANIKLCKIQRPSGNHVKRGCTRSGVRQPSGSRGEQGVLDIEAR